MPSPFGRGYPDATDVDVLRYGCFEWCERLVAQAATSSCAPDDFVWDGFPIMSKMSASGRSGQSDETRVRRAEWHRPLLAVLMIGATGVLSWIVLAPGTGAVPAADRISPQVSTAPASAGLAGQGSGSPYTPAPTATGTAGASTTTSPPASTQSPLPPAPPLLPLPPPASRSPVFPLQSVPVRGSPLRPPVPARRPPVPSDLASMTASPARRALRRRRAGSVPLARSSTPRTSSTPPTGRTSKTPGSCRTGRAARTR